MRLPQIILRGLQILWLILLTGLLGNIVASENHGALLSRPGVNFSMFVTVVAWIGALFGLAATFIEAIAVPIAVLAADGVVILFTLIDAIALAGVLRLPNCGAQGDLEKKCRELQASTAFMFFLFGTFVATLVVAMIGFRRGGGGSVSSMPTMRSVV